MSSHRRRIAATYGLLAVLGLSAAAPAVMAQEKATVSKSQTVTAKVTVKSIDHATRHVVVTGEDGLNTTIKAPDDARNFANLKVGDVIKMSYTLETAYVLSAANTALPADAVGSAEVRAALGERPGGVAANVVVVTGAVIAIDRPSFTFKMVSPQGGQVHTLSVETVEGSRALEKMKVGDTVTAYVTESLLLSVDPV